MTRLLVSREAEADLDAILQYLAENAGPTTAARYGERFAAAIERIVVFPGAGAPRPRLGSSTRIVIVTPTSSSMTSLPMSPIQPSFCAFCTASAPSPNM